MGTLVGSSGGWPSQATTPLSRDPALHPTGGRLPKGPCASVFFLLLETEAHKAPFSTKQRHR